MYVFNNVLFQTFYKSNGSRFTLFELQKNFIKSLKNIEKPMKNVRSELSALFLLAVRVR